MDWLSWTGRRIFLRTKSGKVYSGKVIDVDDKDPLLIFISILDKYGNNVAIVSSEILELKEERGE